MLGCSSPSIDMKFSVISIKLQWILGFYGRLNREGLNRSRNNGWTGIESLIGWNNSGLIVLIVVNKIPNMIFLGTLPLNFGFRKVGLTLEEGDIHGIVDFPGKRRVTFIILLTRGVIEEYTLE